MAKRARPGMRRKAIVLRDIDPPGTLATNLFRAVYNPVVQAWASGAERIIAAYAATVSEMTTDAPADVRAEIDGAAEQINRLVLLLTPDLRRWALSVEGYVRGRWRGAVLSATGVDLQTVIGPEDARQTLANYVEWNANLVADVSAQAKQRIGNAVFSGLSQRKPAREVAKDIREAVSMSRARSVRIASHQLSSLSGELARERRREAGLEVFAWHHSRKAHPRQDHVVRDGKLYTENPALVGKKVDGIEVRAAPPADDRAGVKPFCGCRERAVMVFEFDD
ncbi:MAG: hypothetical protein DI555_06970 [Novosphingobium pentaromativorans]|uniref:Phage head morphogenesis domain-containing protein n=1 Tax=Novosphingobium pentaromativorans TaxID=205844 RepID=A0A2W5NQW3_9SPHN|nr:MAG: hypothetical protein DI555_06970 [Novosphingobium pentaromativorans]